VAERDPRVDRQLPAKIQRRRPLKVTTGRSRSGCCRVSVSRGGVGLRADSRASSIGPSRRSSP
jgi:hypothetical protein